MTTWRWREDAEGNAVAWVHWQNLNEDACGNPKGPPWHGRAWFHVRDETLSVEWNLLSRSCGVSIRLNSDDDSMSGMAAFPPIAVYWSVELRPSRLFSRVVRRVSALVADMGVGYSGSELSLRVHDWAVWWSILADDSGWTSRRPRWRNGCWHPLGYNMRQSDPVVREERDVLVPMPERAYRARAKLTTATWGFTKLPRFTHRTSRSVEINMCEGEQIPFPGKGENAWDCGDDAAFGMAGPAESIEDGIGKLVASVLRDRRRRGWTERERAA